VRRKDLAICITLLDVFWCDNVTQEVPAPEGGDGHAVSGGRVVHRRCIPGGGDVWLWEDGAIQLDAARMLLGMQP
jgi:hypothetical protein